jgi:hypothetical protein
MISRAKFVEEIVIKDPDTGSLIEIEIYKHENGGMFGIDSSYVDQVLDEGNEKAICIPNPFTTSKDIVILEEK